GTVMRMAASLATGRARRPPAPRITGKAIESRTERGDVRRPGSQVFGPDLPVIRSKPEPISRIPLDWTQDTRVYFHLCSSRLPGAGAHGDGVPGREGGAP